MYLDFLNFNDIFDPTKVIKNANPVKDKKFDDDGVYSERIFGKNQDTDNIDVLGWIDFGGYYIVNPIGFERLKKIFGNAKLNKIISYDRKTDKDGNLEEVEYEFEDQSIGLIEFKERFLELLEKYGNKERKEYQTVLEMYEKDVLFIKYFPVFSAKLRPAMITETTLIFDDINNIYNFLIAYTNDIKEIVGDDDEEDVKLLKLPLLYQMQMYAYEIVNDIINNFLKGKKGCFRKIVVGSRVNFSSRNVIIPAPEGKMCDVEMPYKTFLELYKFPLLNLVSRAEGITFNEAHKLFMKSVTEFNPKMYRYMNELLNKTEGGLQILLNRNPTISIGSIMLLNIGRIKDNYNDLALSLSNNILAPLNADYDGDVLNIIALFTSKQRNDFEKISPENLIISNNNGKFNRDFALSKDQRLGVFILNN